MALVGKGLTFDSGGYNLKVQGGIETMKCDMVRGIWSFVGTGLGLSVTAGTARQTGPKCIPPALLTCMSFSMQPAHTDKACDVTCVGVGVCNGVCRGELVRFWGQHGPLHSCSLRVLR